ncbi:MAG: LlaJI family restriction endonuclease [Phascolarctobacterium sp.]|nr:LlaJI family restriction endonuclease [Candidatus Phascolarctobacterium caballi]
MNLNDVCSTHVNSASGDFVGIISKNGKLEVYFPYGYDLEQNCDKDQLRLLFSALSLQFSQRKSVFSYGISDNYEDGLPIQSYMYIIEDYFQNGLFTIREKESKIRRQGKVNWSKTIKHIKPIFNNNSAIYLDFFVNENVCNDETVISQIYKYCLSKSISVMWWFYTDNMPLIPKINIDEKYAISAIRSKLDTTFNDRQKMLYLQMLAILEQEIYKDTFDEYRYGTKRFEYVWEKMIQEVFGIEEPEKYFPATKWHIMGKVTKNSELRPDAIMFNGKEYFVLDAKYYKNAVTDGDSSCLPQSSDINKQITYGEYLAYKQPNKVIYNAFILPFNAKKERKEKVQWVGYADGEWKQNNKEYEKVQAIFIDVKWLMEQAKERKRQINKLSEIIKNGYRSIR